jgi:hypothetical protein
VRKVRGVGVRKIKILTKRGLYKILFSLKKKRVFGLKKETSFWSEK